ncbi:MAG: C2H2-type zinc finger protein [Candidatus Nanohaloarchaea archaeon]|nr:C2H2-type zinc finger protein [Candidatus Nanohaloarchaea archaeon]
MANHDYEEISQKTIAEIKEMVDEEDLDLQKLLNVEKGNKDRKTLKKWLRNRIDAEDTGEQDEEEPEDEYACEKCGKSFDSLKAKREHGRKHHSPDRGTTDGSPWKKPKTVFLTGLAIGLILGAGFIFASDMKQDGMTKQQIRQKTDAYFEEQLGGVVPANITVASINGDKFSDLYVVTMDVATSNRTAQRDVYVTKQSGLLFINSLFGGIPPINTTSQQPIGTDVAMPGTGQ